MMSTTTKIRGFVQKLNRIKVYCFFFEFKNNMKPFIALLISFVVYYATAVIVDPLEQNDLSTCFADLEVIDMSLYESNFQELSEKIVRNLQTVTLNSGGIN